jgi:hypothetical protein
MHFGKHRKAAETRELDRKIRFNPWGYLNELCCPACGNEFIHHT